MVSASSGSHTSYGVEHHVRKSPNLLVNIKGETFVELHDDAYYFWHPGTETFMSEGPDRCIIGTSTAAHHWDVRQGYTVDSPRYFYYMFWSQELHDKRKMALDMKTAVGTYWKNEGYHQKLILKSDGDKEGQVRYFLPFPHSPIIILLAVYPEFAQLSLTNLQLQRKRFHH